MNGDNFEPMAYWELLAPDKDDVVQDELNDVYGYQPHAPISSVAAIGDNPNASATKLNYKE